MPQKGLLPAPISINKILQNAFTRYHFHDSCRISVKYENMQVTYVPCNGCVI